MSDKETFQNLMNTETGRWLAEYSERVTAKVCDVRYGGDMSAEVRRAVAEVIQTEFIDKIKLQNVKKKKKLNDWE